MAAKGPRRPMVLAVDIAGDRAADGDVLSAGDDRHHPTAGHERMQQLADRHPCL